MRTRTVSDVVYGTDGDPLAAQTVSFHLEGIGPYTADELLVATDVVVVSDAAGLFSAELWCNADGEFATYWRCDLPDGAVVRFVLDYDVSSISLRSLRVAGAAFSSDSTGLFALLDARYVQDAEIVSQAELAAHEADTAVVHGITDTSLLVVTSDARLSDARTPTAHNQAFSTITATPTTLSDYGIVDAHTKTEDDARFAPIAVVGSVTSVACTVPSILSVSGSPITTSGTLAVSLADQVTKRFLAGPTSGADAAPTFRVIANADLPNPLTQALTDGASIAWDTALGAFATVTLGSNRTLANPTNLVAGCSYAIKVTQDGTGTRTLAYGSVFKWPGGTVPVLSTASGTVDILTFISDGTNLYGALQKAWA